MPNTNLYVQLLAQTGEPQNVVAMGARLCYSGANISALRENVRENDQQTFLQKLTDMGHMSPIEHVSFTFGIEGVSRALLAQLTRHRIASYSVQSQRYVAQTGQDGFSFVTPPSIIALGNEALRRYEEQMGMIGKWYDEWVDFLGADKKEDARMVLPNAAETKIMMTMNARELKHMLSVRCCNRAQWEIRAMAWAMLGQLLQAAPYLFESAGPSCVCDACSEGKMTCGRSKEVESAMEALKKFVHDHGDEEDFARKVSDWAAKNIHDEK